MKYREPVKTLTIYGEYDVVIVGGGCAGFTAAMASARNKAKTLIIERFPYFGGTATASLMANINGFRNQVEPDNLQTTKGIGEEVILRLKDINGIGKASCSYPNYKYKRYPDTKGNLSYCYPIDTEKFKYITLKMVAESGANILFHTYFSDVIKEGANITGIIFENKSGRQVACGKVTIDASGDGDVAYKAGVPFWQATPSEASLLNDTLMYKITGYPQDYHSRIGCECDSNQTTVLWGPTLEGVNSTDADELTKAEIKARLAVYEDFDRKKQQNPELKKARIIETGPLLGIRQNRFIEGIYKLTGEDVIEGRQFADSIAVAVNPIRRYYGSRKFLEHEGYDISYRCLLPKGVSNLLVAGRCMSTEQMAYESSRAMASTMAIGEAAGTAAALSAINNVEPKQLDIKLLQQQLIKQGAEIGQNRS